MTGSVEKLGAELEEICARTFAGDPRLSDTYSADIIIALDLEPASARCWWWFRGRGASLFCAAWTSYRAKRTDRSVSQSSAPATNSALPGSGTGPAWTARLVWPPR